MFSHQETSQPMLISDLTVHCFLGSISSMISRLSSEMCHKDFKKSRTGLSLDHYMALCNETAQISIECLWGCYSPCCILQKITWLVRNSYMKVTSIYYFNAGWILFFKRLFHNLDLWMCRPQVYRLWLRTSISVTITGSHTLLTFFYFHFDGESVRNVKIRHPLN